MEGSGGSKREQGIKFWWWSRSPCWLPNRKSGHYKLWADFDEIFRIALQWYKEQFYKVFGVIQITMLTLSIVNLGNMGVMSCLFGDLHSLCSFSSLYYHLSSYQTILNCLIHLFNRQMGQKHTLPDGGSQFQLHSNENQIGSDQYMPCVPALICRDQWILVHIYSAPTVTIYHLYIDPFNKSKYLNPLLGNDHLINLTSSSNHFFTHLKKALIDFTVPEIYTRLLQALTCVHYI